MAIPKEPRALMINLMYLVLTVMLALNVSAEIINAFFMIDKSIKATNTIIQTSGGKVIESMEVTVETKKQYAPLVPICKEAQTLASDFVKLVEDLRTEMVDLSGGLFPEDYEDKKKAGKPVGYKNIDVTQNLFVDQGKGKNIKDGLAKLREDYKALLTKVKDAKIKDVPFEDKNIEEILAKLPLEVDEKTWEASGKPSWEAYTFGYMPVAAVYPLLTKFQNDARTAEALIINEIAGLIGKKELVMDKFDVFSSSPKPYILLGEQFEAEIALGAFSSQAKFSVSVNGANLPIQEGKAKYTARPSNVGEQTYKATVRLENPLTGEVETVTKDFKFEVGQPSVAVSLDKMNVFYIGVDNPVTIAAAGISSNAIETSISGGGTTLKKTSGTSYIVNATQQGPATITIKDKGTGKTYPFQYRVKPIPNPVVKLAGRTSGAIPNGEMRAQIALNPELENFDFEARCSVQSYEMIHTARRQDPVLIPVTTPGERFPPQAKAAIEKAAPGDQYIFMNMKVRCPGDAVARTVPGLSFTIK